MVDLTSLVLVLGMVLGGEIVYLWNYSAIKRGRNVPVGGVK